MKKNVSIIIMTITLFVAGGISMPQRAYAIFGAGDIVFDIPAESKEIFVDTMTTTITQRIFGKMVNDAINWGLGGFDGEPSFVSNWDGFLKDSAYELVGGAFQAANNAASIASKTTQEKIDKQNDLASVECSKKVNEEYAGWLNGELAMPTNTKKEYDEKMKDCENQSSGINLAAKTTDIAQANYSLFKSGNLNARNITRILAEEGSKTLGVDELTQIIERDGDTLTRILGDTITKDDFVSDFSKGGWAAYGALSDLANTPSGVKSLITTTLSKQTVAKIDSVVQNMQTPEKFLDKTECDGEVDEDGNCKGKETTVTPGAQVSNLIFTGQNSEFDQTKLGKELSDILAQAVGRLADGLLQKGLSSLTKSGSTTSTNSPAEVASAQFSNTYQSDYDVLGISDDDDNEDAFSSGMEIYSSIINKKTFDKKNSFTESLGSDGSAPYIGGPEDLEGVAWNEGPEYIVNLREKLEPAIDTTQTEIDAYIDMQVLLKDSQDSIMNLDRCLPGPDYNWEKRFRDIFDISKEEVGIAYRETKNYASDSKVNIPGFVTMQSTVDQILGDAGEYVSFNEDLIAQKRSVLGILWSIRDEIDNSFNSIREKVDSQLPLYISDWDLLGKQQQLLLAKKIPNISEKYLILKEENNETIDSVFQNNSKKVRDAVISYAWDLWRTEMGKTTKGKQKKSELRYQYFNLKNDVSSQAQVLSAQSKVKQIKNQKELSENLLKDCHTFRAYVLGTNTSELKKNVSNVSKLKSLYSDNSQYALLVNPMFGAASIIGSKLFGSNGEVQFVDTSKARNDDEIRTFLKKEYNKRKEGQDSYFKTNYFISPSAISQSILGFESDSAKNKYFSGLYNDEEGVLSNALTIKDILKRDKMYLSYRKESGLRGTLFCRVTGEHEANSSGHLKSHEKISNCYRDWYIATELDYKAAISGL